MTSDRDVIITPTGNYGKLGERADRLPHWFEYGKSAADYALAEEKLRKSLGDAGAALSKRTRALIRRPEAKAGRHRPDLADSPSKQVGAVSGFLDFPDPGN